jgi:hypothetical protein
MRGYSPLTTGIMLRMRALPAGFIAPCLPTKTDRLPSGSQWLHETSTMDFGLPAQLFTGSLWRAARPGHPKWGA